MTRGGNEEELCTWKKFSSHAIEAYSVSLPNWKTRRKEGQRDKNPKRKIKIKYLQSADNDSDSEDTTIDILDEEL